MNKYIKALTPSSRRFAMFCLTAMIMTAFICGYREAGMFLAGSFTTLINPKGDSK